MVKKIITFFVFIATLLPLSPFRVNAVFDCSKLTVVSSQADKNYCKDELKQIEAELARLLDLQKQQQKKTGTLSGDVNYLTSQINALKTKIKARSLVIAQLKVNIAEKVSTINSLSEKIEREHESLAQLIRNTNEFDAKTIMHLVLSDNSLSNFYNDFESYASIKQAVKASADRIRGIKTETEVAKIDLEKKQNTETDAKVELENAQKKVAQSEAEKKQLLAISKQTEVAYKQLAAEKKARADKIRAALFPLRDSEAIPFGVALQYAEEAEKKTGVRAAFILAILKQESDLGANVGTCNRSQDVKKWQDIMPGPTHLSNYLKNGKTCNGPNSPCSYRDDQSAFLRITNSLGISPEGVPLSCPLGSGGWGGAMGPSQFIPTTWELFKSKISLVLDVKNPSPWNPRHAIMATAIYMDDLGAGAGTFTAERDAACKYYSGRSCSDPSVKNVSYGNSVMTIVTKIQNDIDLLYN